MSSRALRRAERELAEQQANQTGGDADGEGSEEEPVAHTANKPSLFAILADGNVEEGDDEAEETEDQEHISNDGSVFKPALALNSLKQKRKKRKKRKGKTNAAQDESKEITKSLDTVSGLDEIDKALLALKITSKDHSNTNTDMHDAVLTEEKKQLYNALSLDLSNLHAANEMKRLFGRAALQGIDEEQARVRQRGSLSSGRNLSAISLRKNIFIQGREEWPRATSGGLGMEIVEKRVDGTVEYRFIHNTMYQEVQRKFQVCVGSMDPERMLELLRSNPYHISTLLQVSEIAKQQHDNATATDLLERCLFAFGRCVHSTFSATLTKGKARLDFHRPENREFWLAGWRYIMTLGIRATWRTAFEWAKLLISMNPEHDPYCLRLLIDQLALRGRDPQGFLDLVEADYLQRIWQIPPNLAFSIALAYDRLMEPQKSRAALRNAIKEYPWLAARLCKELDISPIPKAVWGKEPNNNFQKLLCQLYLPKAKDLWNTAEGTTLLVEVCCSFEDELGEGEYPYWLAPICERNLARHVILSDDRALLSLLDPRVKALFTSVSDPIPPHNNLVTYVESSLTAGGFTERQQLLAELEQSRQYFERINVEGLAQGEITEARLLDALNQAGSNMNEFRTITDRLQVIRGRLQDQGVEIVFEDDRDGLEIESDV